MTVINEAAARLLGAPADAPRHARSPTWSRCRTAHGNDWYRHEPPLDGAHHAHRACTEQSWLLSDGTEVLVTARIHRAAAADPVEQVAVSLRSARGRARLDRERSDLVATVAHELRSPLTGVKGFVATLLSKWDKLNDEQKKLMLETVNADADRLTRLIAELLDVARIDTGRLSLYPRPLRLRGAAVERVRRLGARRHRPRDRLRRRTATCPRCSADPDKFTQVRHQPRRERRPARRGHRHALDRVADRRPRRRSPGCCCIVDDEGEGIAPEIRSRVFTKFWKHGTRGGSGLGMYIVHGLVRRPRRHRRDRRRARRRRPDRASSGRGPTSEPSCLSRQTGSRRRGPAS